MKTHSITYEHYTAESLKDGAPSETGFEAEDVEIFSVDDVIDLIKDEGFLEPSQYPLQYGKLTGIWLSTDMEYTDYREGVQEIRALHLDGFSEKELATIFKACGFKLND